MSLTCLDNVINQNLTNIFFTVFEDLKFRISFDETGIAL